MKQDLNPRREFLSKLFLIPLVTLLPTPILAQTAESTTLTLQEEISRNHGHRVDLDPATALKLLRETKATGPILINIQGQSSHPHQISLHHEDLLSLFVEGTLTALSSLDASHTHEVILRLN